MTKDPDTGRLFTSDQWRTHKARKEAERLEAERFRAARLAEVEVRAKRDAAREEAFAARRVAIDVALDDALAKLAGRAAPLERRLESLEYFRNDPVVQERNKASKAAILEELQQVRQLAVQARIDHSDALVHLLSRIREEIPDSPASNSHASKKAPASHRPPPIPTGVTVPEIPFSGPKPTPDNPPGLLQRIWTKLIVRRPAQPASLPPAPSPPKPVPKLVVRRPGEPR